MDLTRVEWRGGMFCVRSLGGARPGDPSLGLGNSSSTCSLKGELGKRSNISGGWTEC